MAGLLTPLATWRGRITALLLVLLGLLPWYAPWLDAAGIISQKFALTLMTRVLILAIAAVSLNLILGYGGMVSFGHAVYIGLGGYTVGILAHHGVQDGFLQFPLAIGLSALLALAIGALSLRTRGVYFIMLTLAFAQLLYYVGVGLEAYGGDDGLTINRRSDFAGLLPTRGPDKVVAFYLVSFVVLVLVLWLVHRLVNARFGMALRGTKSNETRMQALGFATLRYRLAAFVIAGAICGLAGALLANHTEFISPAMMHWTRSGDLIVMVVLGGMGSLFGPLYGAIAFLLLEEFLPSLLRLVLTWLHGGVGAVLGAGATGTLDAWLRLAEYWQIALGTIMILVVLYARGGIDSLFGRPRHG
ncbi:branched-chain amino acid ABC transporter permease [Vineibacter terrae]|uniref:branched-chain amino acid ABC transporter permease n=1 Tax=Vineibacter terrae TaxID=2586908 RepID=UPI002E334441|nr:branched-chain amino acid ABC transporter permease [Vineibacter terrae]HEX2888607.1 branched-chain amino acid ABC transporter permease [Vineibacter terrae]